MTYGRFGLEHLEMLKRKWPEIVRLLTGSGTDLLNEWFESEQLKVTLATDAIIGANASPSLPGTAYILFHHVMGECDGVRGVWGYMRGGMGALSESIAKACKALGVEIFLDTPVQQITVKGKRVTGVVVKGGREYTANIVASGADPNVTFNKLMHETDLPAEFMKSVRRINYDSASVKINLALSELPDFKACPGANAGPQHRGTIHICPDLQFIENAYADSLMGRPSRAPILECTIPSVVDSTIAPAGKHVMNIFSQYGPYALKGGLSWETEREAYADRCLDLLSEYAPNIKGAVLHREVLTPVDLEREFHLTGGNIFHGRMTLDQMFSYAAGPGLCGLSHARARALHVWKRHPSGWRRHGHAWVERGEGDTKGSQIRLMHESALPDSMKFFRSLHSERHQIWRVQLIQMSAIRPVAACVQQGS